MKPRSVSQTVNPARCSVGNISPFPKFPLRSLDGANLTVSATQDVELCDKRHLGSVIHKEFISSWVCSSFGRALY